MISQRRGAFVTSTNTPGTFVQDDPKPVVFTAEYNRQLNELGKRVALALRQDKKLHEL